MLHSSVCAVLGIPEGLGLGPSPSLTGTESQAFTKSLTCGRQGGKPTKHHAMGSLIKKICCKNVCQQAFT